MRHCAHGTVKYVAESNFIERGPVTGPIRCVAGGGNLGPCGSFSKNSREKK
jgi:hypothetical protein